MKQIIILHGWGENKKLWQLQVDKLNTLSDVQAQAWDLPGFGKQELVDPDWGVPEYANWVLQKLQSEAVSESSDIILLGHSFGGRIASYLASQNPSWLQAVVLSGAPGLYRPSWRIRLRIKAYKLLKRLLPQTVLKKVFVSKELSSADNANLGKIFRKVVTFDQTQLLPQISVPCLLIWGEHDQEVPLRIAKAMQQLIPTAKLEVLADCGHNAYVENPELFYGKVTNFVNNLE